MVEIDNHKLMYHPARVAEWKEKGDCYPLYVEIGPTDSCNHKCVFFFFFWVKSGGNSLDKEVMLSTLQDMAEHKVKSVMFAGEGEPLLHKNISLFVQRAKDYGIDVSMSTNGVLFNKEKIEECMPSLSWVRFSIDAGNAKTYSEIHKTKKEDFNKSLDNIREAVNFKERNNLGTIIGAQFLLIPQNIKETLTFANLFKEIGVDNIQIKPYSQHPNSINRLIVKYEDYTYLGEKLKKLNSDNFKVFFREKTIDRLKTTPYSECYGLPFFALIDSIGNIIPCNLFYESEEFTYGNLYEKSFSQIWESEQRKDVREKLRKKGCSECREGCRLDVINRYLHRIKNPNPHDNFI